MNRKELANYLNGIEYPIRGEQLKNIEHIAKENNLLIVFGSSDDLIEFRGIFSDEASAFEGGEFNIDSTGLIDDFESYYDNVFPTVCPQEKAIVLLKEYIRRWENRKKIEAVWCDPALNCSWSYKTDIPHDTFKIMEGKNVYCFGLVIDGNDLKNIGN